jgi:hypothetical protein
MIPRPGTTALLLWSIGCTEYNVGPKTEPETGTEEPEETADTDATADTAESDTPGDTTDIEPGDTGESACSCPDGYTPLPGDDGCVRRTEVAPEFLGESYAVCPLIPHPDYGMYGARYPGGTVVTDDYWGDDDGVPDGRMNVTGVWACGADGVTPGYDPVNEWIGFSVCVDIDEPGEYLLGLGADNRMRFKVDGVELLRNTDDNTENFKYWWMFPISLTSGTHIVEFEGFNAGGPAGLGAELAGPFAHGSLTDDASMVAADYAGSLYWSASDSLGSTFALGETNGWSCPDGMALDLCADEPVCSSEETVPCE